MQSGRFVLLLWANHFPRSINNLPSIVLKNTKQTFAIIISNELEGEYFHCGYRYKPQFPPAVYNTLESDHRCSAILTMSTLSPRCVSIWHLVPKVKEKISMPLDYKLLDSRLVNVRIQMFPMYIIKLEISQLTSGKPLLY